MRLQAKERLICCLLAAILIVSGMCVDIEPADSYLVCSSGASAHSTIRNAEHKPGIEKLCTTEMLRQSLATYLGSNYERTQVKKSSRIATVCIVAKKLLSRSFYMGRAAGDVDRQMTGSCAITVRYIQQQDGKK